MKKFVLSIFMVLALLLAACGGSATENSDVQDLAAPAVATTSENPAVSDNGPAQPSGDRGAVADGEVSELTRLLIGIFQLESTDLALTADQAAALIPMLNSYLELEQSQNLASRQQGQQAATPGTSTGAMEGQQATMQAQQIVLQEQQSALIAQIETLLSSDQLTFITSQELDQEAARAFLEEQGLSAGGGNPGSGGQGSEQSISQGTPAVDQAGNVPQVQGTPGNGNGGPGGNLQDGSAPASMTPGAEQGFGQPNQGGGGLGSTSRILIDALLQLLETKMSD